MDQELANELVKKTKDDFNLIAKEFSQTRHRFWPELANSLRGFIKEEDKILDIGCGNGRLLDLFKRKEIDYIGIDNSEGQIMEAKAKYPEENFFVADALNLPFDNNVFDKVFSIAVFHEIPSLEFRKQFLKETKRVLKKNGLLFLTVWDLRFQLSLILKYSFLKIIGRSKLDWKDVFIPWGDKVQRYYHIFSRREIIRLVKKAGFDIIKTGITGKGNIYLIAKKSPLPNG